MPTVIQVNVLREAKDLQKTPKMSMKFCLLLLFVATVCAIPRHMMDMDDDDEAEMEMEMEMERMDSDDDRSDGGWRGFRADANPANASGSQGQQAGATPPPCRAMAQCFSNDECGEKGRCFGIAVGTCDCSACLQSALCNLGDALGQPQCGGLKNACNETSNLCNCDAAYQQAGFNNFGDAVLKFCSKQQCDGKKDSCFGLPCHAGHCLCV